jgi:hypothetical protein
MMVPIPYDSAQQIEPAYLLEGGSFVAWKES